MKIIIDDDEIVIVKKKKKDSVIPKETKKSFRNASYPILDHDLGTEKSELQQSTKLSDNMIKHIQKTFSRPMKTRESSNIKKMLARRYNVKPATIEYWRWNKPKVKK